MNTHTQKSQENKNQSVSTANSQLQNSGESTFQFVDNRPEAVAQRKRQELANNNPHVKQAVQLQTMADNYSANRQQTIQKKENNTGLPENLKSGIENLSGYSMDDVKVHRNSSKPAQLQAHAYTKGTDIHLGPGQEKYIPHEAWHVVQQKQGRVKPTIQMKGGVNVNDDAGLEKEADVMGAKASTFNNKKTSTNSLSNSSPTDQPIQRKVGLEIEVPSLQLFPGTMRQQPPQHQQPHKNEYSLLLDSDEENYGAMEQQLPYVQSNRPLVKGSAIISGAGWKLTADIIGEQGVIEFITDPIDETNQPNQLGDIARSIETEATRVRSLANAGAFAQLARNVVVKRLGGALEGNIHITGGIKASQIITLLQQMAGWDGTANDLNVDAGSRAILGQAVNAAQDATGNIAGRGPEYQGLVALLGGYVAGQRRYDEMAQQAHETIVNYRNFSEKFYRIQYCANEENISEFMRTGDITGSDRHIGRQYPKGGKQEFFSELSNTLREVIAPRAAKMMVPVLSRSSLGELKEKANMPNQAMFIADVMTAAGEHGGNANTRLFPVGLDTPGHAGRTIEATPDITIQNWLATIYAGQNLKFTDETKSFEKVGPSDVPCFCGLFTTREKGAVLEIRALDGQQLVPANRWGHLADTVSQAFTILNE